MIIKCLNPKCNYLCGGEVCTKCGKSQSWMALESERDALKAKLLALSGQTNCCMQCEGYAKEIERLKAVVKKQATYVQLGDCKRVAQVIKIDALKAAVNTQTDLYRVRLMYIQGLKAQLDQCKTYRKSDHESFKTVDEERIRWKALAEKMAETFSHMNNISYFDDAEGPELRAQNASLHRLAAEGIRAYAKALEEKKEWTYQDTMDSIKDQS